MKKLLASFLVLTMALSGIFAQVTVSPTPLEKGYTGQIVLTFDPTQGNGGMVAATECYSHIALCTSLADWAYIKEPNWGTKTQPQWTKAGDLWQLTIDNMYDYFNCPLTEDVTNIVMVFHNGEGSSSLEGKTAANGDIYIPVVECTPLCNYSLSMTDYFGDGWNGGTLFITENDHTFAYTLTTGKAGTADVPYLGGQPVLTWKAGSYPDEVGFILSAKNGLILYNHERGTDFATDFSYTVTANPCSTESLPYEIMNVKAIDKGNAVFDFTWDENSSVAYYLWEVFDVSNNLWKTGYTDNSNRTVTIDFSEQGLEGTFIFRVSPCNAEGQMLMIGSAVNADVVLPNLGDVTVRYLIPSDSEIDVSQGFELTWTDPDDNPHTETMTRESTTSRWWKAEFNVPFVRIQNLQIASPLIGKVQYYVSCPYDNTRNTNICVEATYHYYFYYSSGDNEAHWYSSKETDCNAPDHDYNAVTATAVPSPGEVNVSWTVKDQAPRYRIQLFSTETDVYDSYTVEDKLLCNIRFTNAADLTIDHWTIRPIDADYYYVGKEISFPGFTVPANPYIPTNHTATSVGDNSYTLSWDVNENVARYLVYCYDYNYNYVLYYSGLASEIPVDGDKFQLTTSPLTASGTAQYYIQAYDANGDWRATAYSSFDAVLTNLESVEFNLLVPSDGCFDASNGVWFVWSSPSQPETCVQATNTNGKWYSASFNVTSPSYSVRVADKDVCNDGWEGAAATYAITIANSKAYYRVHLNGSEYQLTLTDKDVTDHNIVPTAGVATPDAAKGSVTFNLTVSDKAKYYRVFLYKDGSSDIYTEFSILPDESETSTISYVYKSTTSTAVLIDHWVVDSYDDNFNLACQSFNVNTPFTMPANPLSPSGLTGVENPDKSITFSWDAKDGIFNYEIYLYYNGSYVDNKVIYPQVTPAEDGKHNVTFTVLPGNGEYSALLRAWDTYHDYVGNAEYAFNVTDLNPLGDVKIRVLIPSDNNMDISAGVWFWYWEPDKAGQWVKATAAGGNWYEATVNIPGPSAMVLVQNKGAWEAPYEQTGDSYYITSNNVCFEMLWKDNYASQWQLVSDDCTAVDHDFRITNVDVVNDNPGRTVFTITAKDYATYYTVYYRLHGTTDTYSYLGDWTYNNVNTVNVTWNTTADVTYDYRIIPFYNGYQVAAPYEGYVNITANTNLPANLKALVGSDKQTVTFTWDAPASSDVAYYVIRTWDTMYGTIRYSSEHLTELTDMVKLYMTGEYNWNVSAYNAADEFLGSADGNLFYITGKDYQPYNLSHVVNDDVVTFYWETIPEVRKCHYIIFNYIGYLVYEGDAVSTDGHFSDSFTFEESGLYAWSVVATMEDAPFFISEYNYGEQFAVSISDDPTPKPTYNLTISAAVGGSVNDVVNGSYKEGAKVTIIATPDAGWTFNEWSDGDKNATRTITITENTTLEARFLSAIEYKVTISAGAGGKVNTSVNGNYKGGSVIHIIATPDEDYKFVKWSDDNTDAERDIVITEDITLKATFAELESFTLTVTVEPEGKGIVLFDGVERDSYKKTVQEGKSITLTAQPATGYKFSHYEDGANEVNDATYVVKMNKNHKVTAYFVKESEDVDNINGVQQATKFLYNGNLYIRRDGKIYNAAGLLLE